MELQTPWRSIGRLLLATAAVACGDEGGVAPTWSDADSPSQSTDGGPAPLDAARGIPADAGQGCNVYVSDSLIQHACFHELMGPYAERTAGTTSTESGVDLDRAHTSFRVSLPARSEGGYGGFLNYRARFAGGYAIFARGATVRVSAESTPLSASMTHATEICAPLPHVSVYTLAQRNYTLEVTSDVRDVVLVVEYMDEGTVADAYRIECNAAPRLPRDAAVFLLDAGAKDASMARMEDAGSPLADANKPLQTDAARAQDPLEADAGAPADAGICPIDPVLEHSCLHAMHGPFVEVAGGDGATVAPDISRVHTAWQMTLPATSAGRFVHRPNMTGEYVYYLDKPLPLELRAQGIALTPTFVEPVSTCNGISEARVYALAAGERYDVAVGPTADDRAVLVIESVGALTERGWSERFEECP